MVGNLSPFLCLLWPACWLGGCQLGLRGSPKASKKGSQNDPKSIRNPPGRPLACPRVSGVPPGCLRGSQHAFLCIFMHIVRVLMHIFACFVHIYACFRWFPTYVCILLYTSCIFMHIYAYSSILMSVYASMHICIHLWSL